MSASITLDIINGKHMTDVTVHTYISGDLDAIENISEATKKFNVGPWKNSRQAYQIVF
jgi:hypothetical protein